jgi:flagellar biosynthesis GTPase FlhF
MNKHVYTASQIVPAIARGRFSIVHALIIPFAMMLACTGISYADGLFEFQMKLANKGNVEAQFKVGEMYENGFGVEKNTEEGMKWITKAAEQGHETAGFKLLYYDLKKNGVNAGNKAQFDELNNKALAGNGQAEYYVGLMHANGVGVKKDEDKALDWLSKASLVGVTAAEAEITKLRESQQKAQIEQRREAEKRKADEANRKEEERKQAEAKRAAEVTERQRQAEARAKAEKTAASTAEQKEREAAEERARLIAQREAEAREKEKRRQAMLEERKKKEQAQKEQFESDPCSGKSARFLSTCR